MIVILSLLFGSIAFGMAVGKYSKSILKKISDKASLTVLLLLFTFGVTIGGNDKLMSDILHLGASALLISVGCILGSVLAALLITRLNNKGDNERRQI